MSDPKLKKAKLETEESASVDEETVKSLQAIQDEIEKVNEEATEEVLQIERKYNALRRPYYKRRNEVIREIPGFWLKVVSSPFFL